MLITALVCKLQDLIILGFVVLLWCQSAGSLAGTVTLETLSASENVLVKVACDIGLDMLYGLVIRSYSKGSIIGCQLSLMVKVRM